MSKDDKYVSEQQAMSIAEEAGKAAAIETATRLFGMDMTDPEKVREVQQIWDWSKDKKEKEESNRKKAVMVGIGFIVLTLGNWILSSLDWIWELLRNG